MKYQYTYTGDNPVDIPSIGLRDVENGQTVESNEPLYSPFLVEKTVPNTTTKGEKDA